MSELPEGWVEASISQVVGNITYGHTASAAYTPVGPKMVRITDLGSYGVKWSNVPYCECDDVEKYALKKGDLLVARTGATTGKSYLVNDVPEPAVYASYLIKLSALDSYPPEFLARFMRSRAYWSQITKVSKGTAQPGANASILGKVELPVPPLNEQKRIVTKIDALTEKSREAREALDEVPDLLDKLRQSILAAAFRGDLTKKWREQNPNVEPASVLLDRIRKERRKKWEDAELAKMEAKGKPPKNDKWKSKYKEPEPVDTEGLPRLPEGWCWASVGGLCTAVADGVHKKPNYVDEGVPFVTVRNMTAGPGLSFENLNYITQEDHEEYIKRTHPEQGDVLISKDGTLGVVRLIETDRVFSIFVSVAVMKPAVAGFGRHLATMLETPQVQELLVHTGTGLKHIHLTDLRATPIPIPPVAEQEAIQRELQRLLPVVESQRKALDGWEASLATLDASILAKAFRGELVPQDPNDEPASVLLERIRKEREAAAPKKKTRRKGRRSRV